MPTKKSADSDSSGKLRDVVVRELKLREDDMASNKNASKKAMARMELAADSHFSELHAKIQEEFRWDNDHMSFFCLDDNRRKEFCATRVDPWTLEPDPQLREVMRQVSRIGYVFNFFAEKQHLIEVEKAMSDANDYDQTLQMAKGEAFGPGSVW